MTEYYFTAQGLTVGYDRKPLIKDMTFSIQKGEILTLIGPTGAGKSTILKSIARQLTLLGGSVCLADRDLMTFSGNELARQMAVVFTDKLQTELMTCEDVVATGRYPYTGHFGRLSSEDERIVQESMELVHTAGIRNQDFLRISDGQRQRVMLARAICQQPEIIILDEPTSHLDIKYKLEFLAVLQELRRKKKMTVIMSMHELEFAQRISDQVLCVGNGMAQRFGSPKEVFDPVYIARLFDIPLAEFGMPDEKNISCSERIIEEVTAQWQK